jgi:O-antigen/teichoic acid export membrane protein
MTRFRLFAGIGAASLINAVLTALLSLILAKLLPESVFGITRVVTSYFIALSLLGSFTVHDALASFVGRADNKSDQSCYFVAASILVLVVSVAVTSLFILYLRLSDGMQDSLKSALGLVALSLPFLSLSVVYSGALQAIGSYRSFIVVTILLGVVPLLFILPLTYFYGLNGWVAGRVGANFIMFIFSIYVIREYLHLDRGVQIWNKFKELWLFSRVQILSGVLSLVLMSGDVIILEKITSDLVAVANYGLAALFAKSTMLVTSSLGRVYFKELASVSPDSGGIRIFGSYMKINLLLGLAVTFIIMLAGPIFISIVYGGQYASAQFLLVNMACGIVFTFIWNALYVINVAQAKPKDSVLISFVGSITGLVLLFVLVPRYSAIGAVWAMNMAYGCGCILGVVLQYRRGFILGERPA